MNKMSRSRKKGSRSRSCGCDSKDCSIISPENISRSKSYGKGGCLFPTDIKSLLILIAENDSEENRVDIVLDACSEHCFIEDARVVAVMDNTVIVKDDGKFRFICINCICEVIVNCDTILQELFEEHSYKA